MTEEALAAAIKLQELSASDPAVRANLLRQLGALTELVTGQRHTSDEPAEPMFMAGFQLTPGQQQACMKFSAHTGVDQVYLGFKVDDGAGPPCGLGVVRVEDDRVVMHLLCRVWLPVGGRRAVIVPTGDGTRGNFVFRRGHRLQFVDRRPKGDLAAGFRRAEDRLRRLTDERGLCPVEGALTRYLAEGGEITGASVPIAA